MKLWVSIWVFSVSLFFWVLSAGTDEIHLRNGDRLIGEIVKMEEGSLLLKTAYAGEVKLKSPPPPAITYKGALTGGDSIPWEY